MIQIIVTIFTSVFTLSVLYDFSNQKILWILSLLLLYVVLHALQSIIDKHYFTRFQTQDVDKMIIDQLFIVFYLTITFVLTKIILDIVTFLFAICHMQWYDYLNIGLPVLLFMMTIITQIEF